MKNDLTKGNVSKTLILFTFPILISNLLQQLYNIADSAIVGHLLGEQALAAVGASYQISNIILAISMGLTIGMSILISRLYGEGQLDTIQTVVDTGMILCICLSITITILGIVFTTPILHIFRVPDEIFSQASAYFIMTCIGTIASFSYNGITNYLRGIGDSKTSLTFLFFSSIINIALDFFFILVIHMNVSGAALATVIAETFACINIVVYVRQRKMPFQIHFHNLKFSLILLRQSLKIGIPAMLQQLFIGLGNVVIQSMINSYGAVIIAAYTATSKLEGFAILPAINIGKSISNFIAQNKGAGKLKRVKDGIRSGILIITVISLLFTFTIFFFRGGFMRIFTNDSNVLATGEKYMMIVSPFYIIFGLMQLLNGVLIGIGKANDSLLGSILSFCAFQVPIAISLSYMIGISGIWLAAPFGWIAGFILRILFIKHESKSKCNLTTT